MYPFMVVQYIRRTKTTSLLFTHRLMVNNSALNFGGAIYSYNQNNITVAHSLLNDNSALNFGGAIYSYNQNNITVAHSLLNGNHVSTFGGAIYSWDKNNITVIQSRLNDNDAFRGGAIYSEDQNSITVSQSRLNGNRAFRDGGAIYSEDQNNITVIQSRLNGNGAKSGGTLHFGHDSEIRIAKCTFLGNIANQGGAIYTSMGSDILINTSSFLRNQADFGGCLYGSGLSANVKHSRFEENRSLQSGGCFYFELSVADFRSNLLAFNNANQTGGGICSIFNSLLIMDSTNVTSNGATKGGGIAMLSDSRLSCDHCIIHNNTAIQGGGLYIESQLKHVLIAQLQLSTFHSNKASSYGGGIVVKTFGLRDIDCEDIYAQCSRVLLLNTTFVNNAAITTGSIILATKLDTILIQCELHRWHSSHLGFDSPSIIRSALGSGLIQKLNTSNSCHSWKDNRLPRDAHGDIIGTFGWRLNLTINSTEDSQIVGHASSGFLLKNVKSGIPLPKIKVVTIDALGNSDSPTLYERDALTLHSSENFLQQDMTFSFVNGTCMFLGITSYVTPGNYTIRIKSKKDDILEATNLTIIVRQCHINEEPTSGKEFCKTCGAASYNFDTTKFNGCTQCPKEASCNGSFIVPIEGYWHKGPCHDRVKNCIVDKACKKSDRASVITDITRGLDDCHLSNETLDKYDEAQCHKGYKGPLCGSCNSTYGVSSNFECLKCAHIIVVILRFLGIIVYLLIGAIISIKGVLPSPSNQLNEQDDGSPLLEPSSSTLLEGGIRSRILEKIEDENGNVISQQPACEESVDLSISNTPLNVEIEERKQKLVECWKICLNFFQVTSTAASMDVEWTKKILCMLEGLNVLGATIIGSVSYSIDCLISSSSNATRAIWRLLFSLFVPNIVILLLALHWGYRCFTKHGGDHLYFSKRLLLTVVTVTYITYFDLTQIAIKVFSCVGVHVSNDPFSTTIARFWIGDTSIECYKNTHLFLIGIALVILVLVSICFPVLCSITLSQKADEFRDTTSWTYEILGFLGGPFKRSFIYWECITMIKKALLSIIIVFSYSLGNQIQGLLILIVLVLFLYFHTLCFPYDKKYHTLNYYESGSLLVSCVTYALVQFFNVEKCSKIVRSMVSLLLLIINGGFLCLMAIKLVREATHLIRAFLSSKNIQIPEKANIVRLLRIYSKVKRSRFSSP
eukprot:g3834.t1